MKTVGRREFVTQTAIAASAVVLIGLLARLEGRAGAARPQEDWVRSARAEIPAATESAYFQTGGIGPATRRALETVSERLVYQNQGPADPRYAEAMAEIEPRLRSRLSEIFGVGPNGVALTHSTSGLPTGCDATDVYNRLAGERHVMASPVRAEGDLRLAIHFFNTVDEIDAAIEGVSALC
ncbi:MAG: hypothetical protein AAF389_02855 [Gemmatimonadota bacterium]